MAEVVSAAVLKEATRKLADSVVGNGASAKLGRATWRAAGRGRRPGSRKVALARRRRLQTNEHRRDDPDHYGGAIHRCTPAAPQRTRVADRRLSREFIAGFIAMYRFLCASRVQLFEVEGPLKDFACLPVRVVLRPTWLYDIVLRKSLNPRFLRDAAAWSANFDFLARLEDTPFDSALLAAVQTSERAAMANLDVPAFYANTSETAIFNHDLRIEDAFDQPAWYEMRSRLFEWVNRTSPAGQDD